MHIYTYTCVFEVKKVLYKHVHAVMHTVYVHVVYSF